jgi:transposase-like protein
MKKDNRVKRLNWQTGNDLAQCGEVFHQYLRGAIQSALWDLMQEEVQALCGTKYQPRVSGEYRRAGSDDGVFYFAGRKAAVKRPRVRQPQADGGEREVPLVSYQQACQPNNLTAEVMALVEEGLSTRSCQRVTKGALSASVVSRQWALRSAQRLAELRGRNLQAERYFGLMIDGVFLSEELVVVVALGLREDGSKQMLDFNVGHTENYPVVQELLQRLRTRGFSVAHRLFAVLDGAAALRKAVLTFWPDAVIQSCLVHKERNLHGYLRWRDHGECSRLMQRLRQAQGLAAGREALAALRRFLQERNAAALASLDEAGDSLIALHQLNVPATLHVSLLSTNLIENALRNYRRQTGRVTRWNRQSDQVDRWTATALLWVERGFRKIKGHEQLPALLAALQSPPRLPPPPPKEAGETATTTKTPPPLTTTT